MWTGPIETTCGTFASSGPGTIYCTTSCRSPDDLRPVGTADGCRTYASQGEPTGTVVCYDTPASCKAHCPIPE